MRLSSLFLFCGHRPASEAWVLPREGSLDGGDSFSAPYNLSLVLRPRTAEKETRKKNAETAGDVVLVGFSRRN